MTKVEDIEQAISALAPEEFAAFRSWFGAFDAERFDARIERDARGGKLDELAARAAEDLKAGRARSL